MTANKKSLKKPWVDPDDVPALDETFFQEADLYQGATLIRRGRPVAAVTKERVTIRMNPTTVARFRATGKGWQTRMDAALAEWLKEHSPEELASNL
ncbi:MAG: hypothetical protein JWQ10_2246 [Herbaspirillum sp.]|jgi:uncharacterized protein (DUF4415 family)|nr:hypothetical protein [Herbaspirillum sp.]